MADVVLEAHTRTAAGKGAAGRARREGLVPAVVYGLGEDNVHVSVPARELSHALSGPGGLNALITLQVDGGKQLTLARQIQRDPIKGTYLHVDFVRVRADQTIQADVPIRLIGTAEGSNRGGVLEQVMHVLNVEARPGDVPNELEFDITELEIGGAVRVSDLTVPAGVTVRNDSEELIAQISAPRVAEEAAPAEGEAAEGGEGGEGAAASAEGGGEG